MEQAQTIGKYKILREIGRGGMAVVYKALDTNTQGTVALKVLLPQMVDPSAVERFIREANCMARLKHPNIITVSDFGITKGNHYFAMEFIEGETLRNIVKHRGRLPVGETLNILVQVIEALAYAHREGIIHRDIKSGNIMVDKSGRVKVMDFGLVQISGATRVTSEGSILGTAEYMSPEQISSGDVDTRSDIYSLGATMYEMLSGSPPFKADTLQAMLMKHKYELPPSLATLRPDIPTELERIVMKALAKDVSQRYQNVQELLEDINRFKGTQPQCAQRERETAASFKETPAPAGKRRISTKIVAAAVIILLIYIGGRGLKATLKKDKDLIVETKERFKRLEIADGHYNRGLQFSRNGLLDMALIEYEKAIGLRPDYPLYYQALALGYEEKGEFAKALSAWQDLLKISDSGGQAQMAREHIEGLKARGL